MCPSLKLLLGGRGKGRETKLDLPLDLFPSLLSAATFLLLAKVNTETLRLNRGLDSGESARATVLTRNRRGKIAAAKSEMISADVESVVGRRVSFRARLTHIAGRTCCKIGGRVIHGQTDFARLARIRSCGWGGVGE